MSYFFFSGSSRGLPDGVSVILAALEVDATIVAPTITVGTVLKLPSVEVLVTVVMPTIDVGTELELSPIDVEAIVVMPTISMVTWPWWYYDMIEGD
jgi:hypothetical protein